MKWILLLFLLQSSSLWANSNDCLRLVNTINQRVHQDTELNIDQLDLYQEFYREYIAPLASEQIQEINQEVLAELRNMPASRGESSPLIGIDDQWAQSFHQKISRYPVVADTISPPGKSFYDPQCFVGFCFGRAMVAHLDALKNEGIDQDSILKLWLVGDFKEGHWNHHVVTIIRESRGDWYAFDPIFERALLIEDYLEKYFELSGHRLVAIPSASDRLLSAKAKTKPRYMGTNSESFNYLEDQEGILLWKSFFQDAVRSIEQGNSL